jgi:hypothetical protein
MNTDDRRDKRPEGGVVELTRVQPIEAEVIAAKLRASGIPATAGPESVYPSLTFSDGVPVFVPAEDAARAAAVLDEGQDEPQ